MRGVPVDLTSEQRALEMNVPEATERFLIRAHSCSMTLEFFDVDGFILRKVLIPSFTYLSSDGRIVGLSVNEAVQMDASDYRRLVGTQAQSGTWDLGWACRDIP
jgi:hypothetical protein